MIGRLLTRAKAPDIPMNMAMPMGPWPWSTGGSIDPTMVDVTEEAATDLSVVSGFINTLTSVIVQMPLGAYRGTEPIPTPAILRNPVPAPGRVLHDWICEVIRDLVLHGGSLAILADPSWTGYPDALYPVPCGAWSITQDGNYQVGNDVYAPQDVFHVRAGCRSGQMVGRGLLQTHRQLLASAIAAEKWSSNYFEQGAVPPVSITHPDPELTQEKAEILKGKFGLAARRRTAVVVPVGTVVTPLNSDADKSQLEQTRRWNAIQLCFALGIPPALLGLEGPSLTYKNINDLFSQWLTSTVVGRFLVPIEQQLSAQCLPRGVVARFSPAAILRPDLAARVKIAVEGLGGDVYTPDEARAVLDLPPNPKGDFDKPESPVAPGAVSDSPNLSVVPQEVPA